MLKMLEYILNIFIQKEEIRQGCPISPILFIMAVEMLAISIRQDNNNSGVKIVNSAPNIKILQYADDTTLFKVMKLTSERY